MKPIISFSQGGAAARSRIALVRMLLVCVSLWTCSLMMSAQTEEIFFKESFQAAFRHLIRPISTILQDGYSTACTRGRNVR